MELKGVGKKLADKIDQILETGKLEELENESVNALAAVSVYTALEVNARA